MEEIEDVVKKLTDSGLIDDDRFLKSYLQSRLKVGRKGPRLIYWELLNLGFTKEQIDEALKAISTQDELETAKNLLKSRLKHWQNLDPLVKKRRAASLFKCRGFSVNVIRKVLAEI